jgi:hypothetical protein
MRCSFQQLSVVAVLGALAACNQTSARPTTPLTENDKIEALINVVAHTKDAQFIRKGTAYDCAAAAQFMRGKWNWKSSEIKTARDFVRVCSAGGSGEGDPYLIRHTDGTQILAKDFLGAQLDQLEAAAHTTNQ